MLVESRRTAHLAGAILVAVCAVWGGTFVLVKEATLDFPVYEFLALRFGVAALALLPLAMLQRDAGAERDTGVLVGAAVGLPLWLGYVLQTLGLRTIDATRSGLITGLFVVFTPLIVAVWFKKVPGVVPMVGVVLAATGLVLLNPAGVTASLGSGEIQTLGCALCFAIHIVALSRFAPRLKPLRLALGQMLVAAAASLAISVLTERMASPSGYVWLAVMITGIAASAFGFGAMSWAQRHLSPTRVAVILTSEPVFAAVAGFWLLGERLTPIQWGGAAAILAATVLGARL